MKGWRAGPLAAMVACGLVACGGDAADPVPPPVGEPPPPTLPDPPAPPPPAADLGPWPLDTARGEALFVEKCQRCHGPLGIGGYGPALNNPVTCGPCAQFATLWPRIDEFMPLRDPESCDAGCARDIAAWISNGFSTAATCTAEFIPDAATAQEFTATLRLFNFRGVAVPRWRLGFTLPAGHRITGTVNATFRQSGDQVVIESDTGMADGAVVQVGLRGAHPGQALAPRELRLESSPCFTAVSSSPATIW